MNESGNELDCEWMKSEWTSVGMNESWNEPCIVGINKSGNENFNVWKLKWMKVEMKLEITEQKSAVTVHR